MKKIIILAATMAATLSLSAQRNETSTSIYEDTCRCRLVTPLGIGTDYPQSSLHIHETHETQGDENLEPLNPPFGSNDGSGNNTGSNDEYENEGTRDGAFLYNYSAAITLTNTNTLASGLVISQHNRDASIQLTENGKLCLANRHHRMYLAHSGQVGIGDTSGTYRFYVDGTSGFSENVSMQQGLTVSGALTTASLQGPSAGLEVNGTVNFNNLARMRANLSVQGNTTLHGTLSVGNGFLCDASGNLKVKHLKVTLTDWADYVFAPGYRLRSLGEVETYIGEHGHLPGVPSAEEVERDGADLGEMNKVLMEKVEELTLYIIDLQKQIDKLKSNK